MGAARGDEEGVEALGKVSFGARKEERVEIHVLVLVCIAKGWKQAGVLGKNVSGSVENFEMWLPLADDGALALPGRKPYHLNPQAYITGPRIPNGSGQPDPTKARISTVLEGCK